MELLTKIVADAANKAEGNKLNVLGIFHNIQAASVPATLANLALALEFQAQPFEKGREFDVQIALYDPDHKKLLEIQGRLAIARESSELKPVVPIAFNIGNVVFPKTGNYRFEISVDGEGKGEIQLEVQRVGSGAGGT